ncbi:MAG: DUF4177 domain-containing protein [Saprospiraceae bacterium]|jgi:hypothetical protein
MKFLLFFLSIVCSFSCFSQQKFQPDSAHTVFASVSITGKVFKKGISVTVDLGEKESVQIIADLLSKELSKFKSYIGVLNRLSEYGWEFVTAIPYTFSYQGSGETYKLEFIFKRKAENWVGVNPFK